MSLNRRRDVGVIESISDEPEDIFPKMKLGLAVLLVLQTELFISSSEATEHVHFKIYVPEIIKHHVHTKTIFIHVHEPKKKPPPKKNEHVETHYDDWSVWSGYSNYDNHGSGRLAVRGYGSHRGHPGGHQENQGHVTPHEGLTTAPGPPPPPVDNAYPSYYRDSPKSSIPHYDDYRENYHNEDKHSGPPLVPPKSVFRNGVTGYSYPPQYEIHENVVEDGPENYKTSHEEAHINHHQSEMGHLYTNELENVYDDKHEEGSEVVSSESNEVQESFNKDGYRYLGNKYNNKRMIIT